MVNPARALLSGAVEIDETQVSYRTKDDPVTGGGGRSPYGKMQVAVAVGDLSPISTWCSSIPPPSTFMAGVGRRSAAAASPRITAPPGNATDV